MSNSTFGSTRRLKSGRYQVRYSDGSGVRRSAPRTFATKTEANDFLASVRGSMLAGTWVAPERSAVTVSAYAHDWINSRRDLAPRTVALYRSILRRWIDTPLPIDGGTMHLGILEVGRVDPALIRKWYAAVVDASARSAAHRTAGRLDRRDPARIWATTPAGRAALDAAGVRIKPRGRMSPKVHELYAAAGSPPPAPKSGAPTGNGKTQAAQAYRFTRVVFSTATDDGLIRSNPCRIARAGLSRAAERPLIEPGDVYRLALEMPDHLSAAIHVAAWSGLRPSELFALDREHVDLTAGAVSVVRSLVVIEGKFHSYGPPKTAAGQRIVHLPPHVTQILADHLERYPDPDPAALVFARADGSPVLDGHRNRPFHKARKAIGRPALRWYDLRHFAATMAARSGATTRELQARIGHASADAALIYQHSSDQRDRELAARLSTMARSA
ncbi:site-specific integrase [Gordonia sp. CPCC 206044]|uniref:tyrosine-type recombinase/integrase n=1 Tax=Gordonia sp. CPCC 206044 TaxID=3140793 RepID=UPI003AF3DBDC